MERCDPNNSEQINPGKLLTNAARRIRFVGYSFLLNIKIISVIKLPNNTGNVIQSLKIHIRKVNMNFTNILKHVLTWFGQIHLHVE